MGGVSGVWDVSDGGLSSVWAVGMGGIISVHVLVGMSFLEAFPTSYDG